MGSGDSSKIPFYENKIRILGPSPNPNKERGKELYIHIV